MLLCPRMGTLQVDLLVARVDVPRQLKTLLSAFCRGMRIAWVSILKHPLKHSGQDKFQGEPLPSPE